jgi:hypothetical protein
MLLMWSARYDVCGASMTATILAAKPRTIAAHTIHVTARDLADSFVVWLVVGIGCISVAAKFDR